MDSLQDGQASSDMNAADKESQASKCMNQLKKLNR